MIRKFALSAALAVAAFAPAGAAPAADEWEIGPIIKGRNYSVNMPLRPSESREGATFAIPGPTRSDGHVHYVTMPVGSLEGARQMVLRYRIDAGKGTQFVAQEHPDRTALVTLYFQRRGDRWTSRFADYRWYAPIETSLPLSPGVHEIVVPFTANWKAVGRSTRATNPAAFAAALEEAGRAGFVFGSAGGRGHGVYATAPARFTVLDFRID